MPTSHDDEQLYRRGKYRLEWDRKKDGSLRSPFIQIVWYDEVAGRNRSRSTATTDIGRAEHELDKLYQQRERGQAICPTCGRALEAARNFPVSESLADYLVARDGRISIDTIKARIGHLSNYLTDTDQHAVSCEDIDEEWVAAFREWAMEIPVTSPNGTYRERSPGTVEGSVRMLAAAINFSHGRKDTLFPASFTPIKASEVSRTPKHRSTVAELADMFKFALETRKDTGEPRKDRQHLLNFLRISVATLARPDAAHDVSTSPDRDQWHAKSRTLDLNPKGRRQTRKYRPTVPIAAQMALHLDKISGFLIPVDSVKSAFQTMQDELKLPRQGETGLKLIRRSMAKLLRDRMDKRDWDEISMFLGHRRFNASSDDYAPFSPDYLSAAKSEIERIIGEIEALAPGAFHRKSTGARLRSIK